MKKLLSLSMLAISMSANAENLTVDIKPNPTYCVVGSTCNISAVQSIVLQNTSSETRTYKVTYQICADNKECAVHVYNVPIAPTHIWRQDYLQNLFTTFNRRRKHAVTYWINVSHPMFYQQKQLDGEVDVR